MSTTRLLFDVRHGFGKLDLVDERGETEFSGIPAELVERPDVLEALLMIARSGGKRLLDNTDISEVLVVDGDKVSRMEMDA